MNRTPEQLAKELSELKWGDSLSALKITANEAHELGKAFVKLNVCNHVWEEKPYPGNRDTYLFCTKCRAVQQ